MHSLVTYFRPQCLTIPWTHFQALHREHAPDVAELWSGIKWFNGSIYAIEGLVNSPKKYIAIVQTNRQDFPYASNLERIDEEHIPVIPSSFNFINFKKIVLKSTSTMSILDETAHMILEIHLPTGQTHTQLISLNIPALLTKEQPGAVYTYKIQTTVSRKL